MATHSLAKEFEPEGVFLMALHPGHVKTDMGGENAPIEKHSSISGCLKVIFEIDESKRGKLYQFDGIAMDW